jgi:hypothetical protein
MAGKRPDQYQIDPAEGRTTDHKTNPQGKDHRAGDEDALRHGDKQRLAESKRGGQPFLPDVPSPSAEAQRAASHAADGDDHEEIRSDDANTHTTKGNPLA